MPRAKVELSEDQETQLDDLISDTVMPALFEDLCINDKVRRNLAIKYLIEELKSNIES